MADDCEIASDVTERWLAGAIAKAAVPAPKDVFVPNGKCRWCHDPVGEGLSFCPAPAGTTGCLEKANRAKLEAEYPSSVGSATEGSEP